MADTLVLRGTMRGHTDVVTAIATPIDNSDRIVSSSRDKSVLVWKLTKDAASAGGDAAYGVPQRRLTGHSHFVQDVVLSSDGQFALSDRVGLARPHHQALEHPGRVQVHHPGRRRSHQLGQLRALLPSTYQPLIVSGSWDRTVKVWNLTNCKLRCTLTGHAGYVNTVAVSPDGSLCASGGKDGVTLLWDLAEGKRLYSLDAGAIIHALCFSPNRYWLCAATQDSVKIWDLESKSIVQDLKPETPTSKNQMLYCTSLSWSIDGSTLFTGYTDGTIRVWKVNPY
uniref:Uncharacterized protein n=1 Tax=Ananas comosus var. bracteatus TaxID=296719 RepID=A0A6V7NXS1_ANACO|nr:unnamed protein product [Ananas comosus var. bracteatus]